jgi:hypothetical protein
MPAVAARGELEMAFQQSARGPEFGQNFIFGHHRTPSKT